MKKEIIISENIIKDLSQNSVQNNNEEFIFWYDKILDEKGFYEKDWTLDINKILIYKEYLKYEYLDLLGKVYWKFLWKNSFSSKIGEFLKVKNELKYIINLIQNNNNLYYEKFFFWFKFSENWFDTNDSFWYKNRKNIDDVEWQDIYNLIDNTTLKKIKKIDDLWLYEKFVSIDYKLWKKKVILSLKNSIFNNLKKDFRKISDCEYYDWYIIKYLVKIDIFKEYISENIITILKKWKINFYDNIGLLESIIVSEKIAENILNNFKEEINLGLLNDNKALILSLLRVILKKEYSIVKVNKLFLENLIWWSDKIKEKQKKIEKRKLDIKREIRNYKFKFGLGRKDKIYLYQSFWDIITNYRYNYVNSEKDIIKLISNLSNEIKNDFYNWFYKQCFNLFFKISNNNKLLNSLFINFKKELKFIFDLEYKNLKTRLFINLMRLKEARKYFEKDIFNSKNYYQQKISSFIKNSDSGSFLLSGYRWVWKTSLLKKSFNEFYRNNEEKVIPVFVNIPEPDKKKGFSKKQLMNFIIRNLYRQVLLNPWNFPKSFERKLEDQYIRTFKDVKNIEWELVVRKRGVLRYILAILQYWLPFWFGLLIFIFWENIFDFIKNIFWEEYKIIFEDLHKNFGIIQLIIAFWVFIIWFKISFSFINVTFKSKIAEDLYDENIAEQKLTDNLWSYNNYLDTFWFKIWNWIFVKSYNQILNKITDYVVGWTIAMLLSYVTILWILILILYFIIKIMEYIPYSSYVIWYILLFLIWVGIVFLLVFLLKKYFSRPKYKFVIVIDELDKLLDFDKNIGWSEKGRMNMNSIFDILWKLKILFFDTKGLLFFVVTNKDAYDYHLVNKYQEDDLVSNIFNRILYLPMNEKEKFNLNFSVLWEWKNNFSSEELNNFNKWLYFKSHWNWRKMRFILNEKLSNNWEKNILKIDLDKLNFENKFYEFFEDIYNLLQIKTLEKIDNWNILYKFLIWNNNDSWEKEDKRWLLIKFIEWNFYKNYLLNIWWLLEKSFWNKNNKSDKNNIYTVLDILNQNINDKSKNNSSNILFKNIWFFITSIEKVSEEKAFRDYILNNLLNFYEALVFYKKIDFNILLEKIKIDKEDLNYPAFEDLILYWLPFMLFYLWEKDFINKNEFDNIFEKNIDNKDSLSTEVFSPLQENNILKINSEKEENILIDVFLNQSIQNLNSEWWFNLKFDEIKNNDIWRKFIKTKLEISFWIIKNYEQIDKDVFEFWRDEIIWKFLKNKWYISVVYSNLEKAIFYLYYKRINLSDWIDLRKRWFVDFVNEIYKYSIMFSELLLKIPEKSEKIKIFWKYGFLSVNIVDNNLWKKKEDRMNYIYSKINPLDDIKVIKEEWFKK